jgi:hypothetical protein
MVPPLGHHGQPEPALEGRVSIKVTWNDGSSTTYQSDKEGIKSENDKTVTFTSREGNKVVLRVGAMRSYEVIEGYK